MMYTFINQRSETIEGLFAELDEELPAPTRRAEDVALVWAERMNEMPEGVGRTEEAAS